MALNATNGEFISIDEAAEMTSRWRDQEPGATLAGAAGKDKIQQILDQSGSTGIRIYFAINEKDEKSLVLVGMDADGNDQYEELILEKLTKCPTDCPATNPLNS